MTRGESSAGVFYNVVYIHFISQIPLQRDSRPRMHSDNVFEKAARLVQDGGDGPVVRREWVTTRNLEDLQFTQAALLRQWDELLTKNQRRHLCDGQSQFLADFISRF